MHLDKHSSLQVLRLKYFALAVKQGIQNVLHNPLLWLTALLCIFVCIICWLAIGTMAPMYSSIYRCAISILAAFFALFWLHYNGTPRQYWHIMRQMQRVGLTNAVGETPALISRSKSSTNPKVEIWEYETFGVAFSEWENCIENLESGLNVAVIRIDEVANGNRVRITLLPTPEPWPTYIPWADNLLPFGETVLALGDNRCEQVTVNLAVTPHLLIAGKTGSGKSVLMKLLMYQCLYKGMRVIIVDYKQGVDYNAGWKDHCEIMMDDDAFIDMLTNLQRLMLDRLRLLREVNATNISEYNEMVPSNHMNHIVLVVDEVAECLDKTGATIERKKVIAAIEQSISSICRLGRAAGIHVILGMQRGSADVLNGQIRNNCFKILGSCDDNLAILTLGNADAARRIPHDAQGRFLDENGNLFQGYYMNFSQEAFENLPARRCHDPDGNCS